MINFLEIYADLINRGDNIIVRNCKIPVINYHMRMSVDAFGKIEISNDSTIENVKLDRNFSDVVYDNYADRKLMNFVKDNTYNYRDDRKINSRDNQYDYRNQYDM